MNINGTMISPPPTFAQPITKPNNDKNIRNQFMALLTEQMKNQDPTDPLKPREQIAQLAQLSSLEQSQTQTETLKSILNTLPDKKRFTPSPVSLVGRKIEFRPTNFMIPNDAEINYKIDHNFIVGDGDITVMIKDRNGRGLKNFIVHKDDFNDSLSWNGEDNNGSYIGYRPVSMTATQETKNGEKEVKLIASSDVKSFNFHSPNLMKLENEATISADDIVNVF